MSVYGKFRIHIEADATDRVGLRTLVLYQRWQASRGDMTTAELDQEEPAPPEVDGGVLLINRRRRREGGLYRTSWAFEGINGNGKDVTFRTRGNSFDYGFDPGFAQSSLQIHPRGAKLMDDWQGQQIDNEIYWPRIISVAGAKGGIGAGLGGSGKKQEIINPMWGRQDYFAFQGGTYWYRYLIQDEGQIPNILGKIFKAGSLPGRAPSFGNRDYLGAGAPFQRRGGIVEVVEQYWLSEEGGWPKLIYGSGTSSSTGQQTLGVQGAGSGLTQ